MKPLNLKMKAFLGFKEETEIDFRPLYEDKIFLITGPTGAGKTSIFDAVAYALYGEGSGETRTKAKCFRSQLAGEKENMEVALDFEVRGELYHVHRIETARGLNKATFYKVSDPETMWTKIRDVNQEIETIIGLNLDQFKKIVMIPQGEFREFLTAGTKDKSDILKKLFATEQYEIFQRKIKESFDVVVGKDKDLVRRFSQIIRDTGLEEKDIELGPDALKDSLSQEEAFVYLLKEEEEKNQRKIKALDKEVEEAKFNNSELQKFEEVREAYLLLENQYPSQEEKKQRLYLLRKVAKVATIERDLLEKEKDIRRLKVELAELGDVKASLSKDMEVMSKVLSTAKEEAMSLDDKKERRIKLKEWIFKSSRMVGLNQDLTQLVQNSEGRQGKLDGIKVKKEELENLRQTQQKIQGESHQIELELSNLQLTLHEKEEELKVYRTLYQKIKRKEEMEKSQSELNEEEKMIWILLDQAREDHRLEEEKRNESYALVLRDDLKDHEPCPVCGSLDHPLNVTLSEHHDKENLQKLSTKVKEVEEKLLRISGEVQGKNNLHKDLMEELEELLHESQLSMMSSDELKGKGLDKTVEINQVKKEQEFKQDELKKQKEVFLRLMVELKETEKMVKDEAQLTEEKRQLDERLNAIKGEIRSLEQEGTPKNPQEMKTELSDLELKIDSIETKVKKAQNDYELARDKEHKLLGQESELSRTLVQAIDLEKNRREEFAAALEKEELKRETYETHREDLDKMDSLEEDITQFDRVYYEKKGIFESLRGVSEKRVFQELDPLIDQLAVEVENQKEKQKELKSKEFLVLNLHKAHIQLGETYEEYTKNKKELAVLQNLYDTANLGMGFETFVQSYYFEGILIRANQRLKKMSEGRYQLRRRNETENRREKIGLGLNVFDEYSGRERDVMSLSGGESFKASLSLALGLSDFIESHKGSVNLETIFIDEGFGSLDQDSLDNALECLLELNVSGRIVGIISHVTELKDRIPGRIEVTSKPGQGSRVKVNGGVN